MFLTDDELRLGECAYLTNPLFKPPDPLPDPDAWCLVAIPEWTDLDEDDRAVKALVALQRSFYLNRNLTLLINNALWVVLLVLMTSAAHRQRVQALHRRLRKRALWEVVAMCGTQVVLASLVPYIGRPPKARQPVPPVFVGVRQALSYLRDARLMRDVDVAWLASSDRIAETFAQVRLYLAPEVRDALGDEPEFTQHRVLPIPRH